MDETKLLDLKPILARARQAKRRADAATRGPWFAHATDDQVSMNARYVGLRKGPSKRTLHTGHVITVEPGQLLHDGGNGMDPGAPDQEPSNQVVAITLLQSPRLADPNLCDENTLFIATARDDVPDMSSDIERLVTEIRQLRAELRNFQSDQSER